MDTYPIPVVAWRDLDAAQDQPAHYFDFGAGVTETKSARALLNVSAARQLGFGNPQEADEDMGLRVKPSFSS